MFLGFGYCYFGDKCCFRHVDELCNIEIKGIEEHFEKKLYDLEKTVKIKAKIKNVKVDIQSMEIEKELIKCEKCEFTTTSEKGFKTHMKRKHPVEIITFKCELCDYETKRKIELKCHKKSHMDPTNSQWKGT